MEVRIFHESRSFLGHFVAARKKTAPGSPSQPVVGEEEVTLVLECVFGDVDVNSLAMGNRTVIHKFSASTPTLLFGRQNQKKLLDNVHRWLHG